ncbi:hypothetical protein GLA29479_3742 [Lysobacter antibioticus]|uniref:hypothetical protein n=1 Tax=Lysobacter antibioticus TaxID=84531 RepID=UPI00071F8570|nr:hypothetical protein [Lysobacter antibioticus]ALN64593.1 hypothetical protein GLA29479_3742 [Lysobacter antibioticus]
MQDGTQTLKDFLSGMKTGTPSALAQLTVLKDWTEVAQREIERRATFFLQKLPDDVICAIAEGEIDVRNAIGEVLSD